MAVQSQSNSCFAEKKSLRIGFRVLELETHRVICSGSSSGGDSVSSWTASLRSAQSVLAEGISVRFPVPDGAEAVDGEEAVDGDPADRVEVQCGKQHPGFRWRIFQQILSLRRRLGQQQGHSVGPRPPPRRASTRGIIEYNDIWNGLSRETVVWWLQ